MEPDSPSAADAISALLQRAEQAHGVYEATELGGVYDRDWPRWYAEFAIEHGLAALLGRPAPLDRVASFLGAAYADFDRADPKPTEGWAAYIGRRIAAEL
jgi:hypothetical protein